MAIRKKEIILNSNNMPKHIALIMDGNGRWAKKRGLPRTAGHKVGAERIFDILEAGKELNIEAITVFAFSTENWKRSEEEIRYIFKLLEDMIDNRFDDFTKENIKVRMIGTLDRLDGIYDSLKSKIIKVMDATKDNTGLIFNIAFNYGSHDEMIRAIKNLTQDVKDNKVSIDSINESLFENYLMTKGLPSIDLMIRTSGESRLSNFLLWQLAYSELIFTPTHWPDFNARALKECIYEYQNRDRRFGNVK